MASVAQAISCYPYCMHNSHYIRYRSHLVFAFLLVLCLTTVSKASWPSTPRDELNQIYSLIIKIDTTGKTTSRYEQLSIVTEVGHRLQRFDIVYGVNPNTFPRYRLLAIRAQRLLKLFAAPKADLQDFTPRHVARFTLLEIAGKYDQLVKECGQTSKHCPNAPYIYVIPSYPLSRMYQRQGNYQLALKHIQLCQEGLKLPPFDYAREAFFNSKLGNSHKARSLYQLIIDLYPGTEANRIAEKKLKLVNAYSPPNVERVSQYLSGKFEAQAAAAIAYHKFPNSFEMLSKGMKEVSPYFRTWYIHAFGILGDDRAIAILEDFVLNGTNLEKLSAVKSLIKLGELQYFPHYFDVVYDDIGRPMQEPKNYNSCLLSLVPSGPKIKYPVCMDYALVIDAWKKWSKAQIRIGRKQTKGWITDTPNRAYRKPVVSADSQWIKPVSDDFPELGL